MGVGPIMAITRPIKYPDEFTSGTKYCNISDSNYHTVTVITAHYMTYLYKSSYGKVFILDPKLTVLQVSL